ncbi:MAG: hypothetical protein P8078_03460, partial [bacterium]
MKKSYRLTFIFFATIVGMWSMRINAQSSLQEEMRLPWATSQKNFFREWLTLGGFPNQDGKGFDTDYLQEHGGEANIVPVAGMTHTLPNGLTFAWKKYESPYNYVNFFDVLKGTDFSMKVVYAYKTINRPADGN